MFKRARTAVVSLMFILGLNTTVFSAASFKDVPSTHWAYPSITKLADQGIIVGDSSGNYNPDQALDKFSTSKMLAKVAGYKYINVTQAEQQYYDKAYKANEYTISLYRKAFTRWDSTADREIAFLLEKEILTVEDLNQFVLKMTDGSERLRGLSREEVSVFLVKLMGKRNEALNTTYSSVFDDDSSISANARPYVNYLKSIGVVAGGSDNKFNPKNAVTKAAMAVMLDKTISFMEGGNENTNNTNATQATNTGSNSTVPTQSSNIESVSGKIDKIYSSLNAVQIVDANDKKNIWKVTQNANIYIDGFNRTLNDVKEGMNANIVINNNEIVEIRAQSLTTGTVIDATTNQQLSTLEGIVAYTTSDSTTKTVGVKINVVSPSGDINSVITSYVLTSDCKITRGSHEESFANISDGDIIRGQVSGNKIYSIRLVEKNLSLTGKLIEKSYVESTDTVYLKVEDMTGEKYDFRVTNETFIERKSYGTVKWNELRVGDSVRLTAEYDILIEFYAEGSKSTKEGIVEEIHITRQNAKIVLKDSSTSDLTTYEVIPESADVYVLKVGSRISVLLDSAEVERITVIEESSTTSMTGYIQSIKDDSIGVSSTLNINSNARQIIYDNNTTIVDGITGGIMSPSSLEKNMRVFITLSATNASYAQVITVLR